MAFYIYWIPVLCLLAILLLLLHRILSRLKPIVFIAAAMVLTFLFCNLFFDGLLDAHRHLAYCRQLQGADDASIRSKQILLGITELPSGRPALTWRFHIRYRSDPDIRYIYNYDPAAGMTCRFRTLTDGSAYAEMQYHPPGGAIRLP